MTSCRIREARLVRFRLPLGRPWCFGSHQIDCREGWLVRLTDRHGRSGWGETTPLPLLGTEGPAAARAWLDAMGRSLSGRTPAEALDTLPPAGASPPAARCGMETALLDLSARQAGVPLARFLNPDAGQRVEVNGALGTLADTTSADLRSAARAGLRCVKLKVGLVDPDTELRRLRDLIEGLPAGLDLRLDANQAWSWDQAIQILAPLHNPPIELLEEPLAGAALPELAALRDHSPVPLGLDEGLGHTNLAAVLAMAPVDVLVLKPMRLGGLLPCLEIHRQAAASGMACLATTTLDGAIGTWATVHLAAALDAAGTTLAHGLATGEWLARDLAPGPQVENGHIAVPHRPGLGCEPTMGTCHGRPQEPFR